MSCFSTVARLRVITRSFSIIHTLIASEEQYVKDLDVVETVFMKPLQRANPPVISPLDLDEFVDDVFHNIFHLRECNRRLLDVLLVRQREQYPFIERIGDVFLEAATEFRMMYPEYVGHHPIAEKRVKEELERNAEFRVFIEVCNPRLIVNHSAFAHPPSRDAPSSVCHIQGKERGCWT
jgi:hypothetical protein